jgi:hypothetical protein
MRALGISPAPSFVCPVGMDCPSCGKPMRLEWRSALPIAGPAPGLPKPRWTCGTASCAVGTEERGG